MSNDKLNKHFTVTYYKLAKRSFINFFISPLSKYTFLLSYSQSSIQRFQRLTRLRVPTAQNTCKNKTFEHDRETKNCKLWAREEDYQKRNRLSLMLFFALPYFIDILHAHKYVFILRKLPWKFDFCVLCELVLFSN